MALKRDALYIAVAAVTGFMGYSIYKHWPDKDGLKAEKKIMSGGESKLPDSSDTSQTKSDQTKMSSAETSPTLSQQFKNDPAAADGPRTA